MPGSTILAGTLPTTSDLLACGEAMNQMDKRQRTDAQFD
jgi:hypothetical protein